MGFGAYGVYGWRDPLVLAGSLIFTCFSDRVVLAAA